MRKVEIPHGCAWTQQPDGEWETACGNCFEVNEGTPHENTMAYCPYCGLPLEEYPCREDAQ